MKTQMGMFLRGKSYGKNLVQTSEKKCYFCFWRNISGSFLGCFIGWMEQFENISRYLGYRFNTGSYIAYFSGDLTQEDIVEIAEDENVSQCGVVTYYKKIAEGKGKDVWLRGAAEDHRWKYMTTKQEPENHGCGLKSVQQAAAEYHGSMDTE